MTFIDSYKTLPLGTYLEILDAQKITEDLERQVKVISLLSGLTESEVLNLPIMDYREMAGKSLFLTKSPDRYPRPADKYQVGGFTLIPTKDLAKITTAQYIDFQHFAPGGDATLAETLSCFLVPEGKNYNDGYDIVEVHNAIKSYLMVWDALGLLAFFLSKLAGLMRVTQISLSRLKRKKMLSKEQEAKIGMLTEAAQAARMALRTNGVG